MLVSKFLLGVFLLCFVISAHSESDELPQDTVDPTAPLPSINFQSDQSLKMRGKDGRRTTYALSISNPYKLWKRPNLLHISIPYSKGTGISAGQGSTQIANLLIFRQESWRYAIGIDAGLNSPRLGREGIQYGPALGVVRVMDQCRLGMLNANYFSDDVSLSGAQLIAGCSLGNGWTLSAGGFTVLYDWKSGTLMEFPLSVQGARVVSFAGQPLQFFVNPRYNLVDTRGTFQWSVIFGVTFVADPI